MKKHLGLISMGSLVILAMLIFSITYQVDELKDIILVETFGKVTRVQVGRKQGDAGLKLKLPRPFQRIVRYDSRAHVFDDTSEDTPTRDKQKLIVTVYCAWRIEKPEQFHKAVREDDPQEKVRMVQERIRGLVRNYKKDVVGRYDFEAFVNTDPEKMRLPDIEREILGGVREIAMRDYGVEVLHVGIKSLGLPEAVTTAVIDAMKEERQRDVKRHESQGEAQANAIEARATEARDKILAFAERKAKEIRSEGDRAAAEYYELFEQAKVPELSIFLRSLESLKKWLADRTVMVLDANNLPAIRWLRDGAPETLGELPAPAVSGGNQ